MEDSTEKNRKPEMIPKRVASYLPIIFKSLLQIPMSISRFLRFQLFRQQPHDSSSASTVAPDPKILMAANIQATPQTSRGITLVSISSTDHLF